MLDSLFAQPLFKFSLVYLLVWNPPLHTPYIFSPNCCLLFATHAHTIAVCFAVVPRLCHLILVSVPVNSTWNSLFTLKSHVRLTILVWTECIVIGHRHTDCARPVVCQSVTNHSADEMRSVETRSDSVRLDSWSEHGQARQYGREGEVSRASWHLGGPAVAQK